MGSHVREDCKSIILTFVIINLKIWNNSQLSPFIQEGFGGLFELSFLYKIDFQVLQVVAD